MTSAAFVIPGDLSLPTGGYAYDRQVLALLAAQAVDCAHVPLPGTYPAPSIADLATTERTLAALPRDTILLFDGLAFGALPGEVVGRIQQKIIALVHHPLCLEAGLAPMRARYLRQTETMALAFAEHVVVTSALTARILAADFGVAPAAITVAEPGTDRAPRATGTGHPLQILAVGSIVPRKGYGILADALLRLPVSDDWHVTIVGAVRDISAQSQLDEALQAIAADGQPLASRVTLAGAVDDATLADLYHAADVFVMPSLFEGYGMVLAEAMARGLPIVCTTGGAAAETAPDAAALKVPPGDAAALRTALATVIANAPMRHRMADAAWAAGQSLPTWNDTTRIIADRLKRVHV
jgi:glycosyltransferase involved in cell wall biosynthesis